MFLLRYIDSVYINIGSRRSVLSCIGCKKPRKEEKEEKIKRKKNNNSREGMAEVDDEMNVNRKLSVFKHIKKKAANDAQLLMYGVMDWTTLMLMLLNIKFFFF